MSQKIALGNFALTLTGLTRQFVHLYERNEISEDLAKQVSLPSYQP